MGTMQIISLELENIRSYPRAHIDFPTGIVMLSGDIGSGKSTILLAIEFALFGLLRGELSGSALLRNGSLRGSVELAFAIGEHKYHIKRTLKRSKDTVEQEAGYLLINGVKTEGTAVELKSKILDLLGYPQEQLTKAKNLIYRYTLYTPQEEMKHILLEGREERLALLRKVFDIDKYALIVQNAGMYTKALRERKRALDLVLGDLEEKKTRAENLSKEISDVKSNREKSEQELVKARAQVEEAKIKLAEAEKKRNEAEKLKAQVQTIKARMAVQESQMVSQKKEIELITIQQQGLVVVPEKPKMSSQDLSKQIMEKELELRNHLNSSTQAIVLKQQAKQTVDKVKALAQCPTCLQNVTDDHKASIVKREQEKMDAAQAQEQSVKEHVQKIEGEINLIRKQMDETRKVEQEIALAELKRSQAQAISKRKEILEKNQFVIIDELAAQKKTLAESEEKARSLDTAQYDKARKEAESIVFAERNASIVHASILQKEEQMTKQLALLAKDIEQKERGKRQLEKTQNVHHWLTDYFVPLMEVMEKHVMAKIHHEFDALFQQWFSMLVEDLMTARLDESFTPVVQQNGYDMDISHLSGGERTACALAYRLALNKTINAVISSIRTKDLLILDEPTEGFSTEQLDKMRDVIAQLDLRQIIIVSHEQKVEGFADKVIRLEKTQSGTVII